MRTEDAVSSLLRFRLTEGEAKVYVALLRGSSTKSDIIKNSGISSSVVYEILERLMRKGLASFETTEGKKKFYAANPEKLFDLIRNERKKIEKIEKEGKRIIPFLKQISKEELLFANVYKGLDGLKAMLSVIEEEIKKQEIKEWLAMGVTSYKNELFNRLWLNWHKSFRAKHKIKAKFLFCEKSTKYYSDLKKVPSSEIKHLTSMPLSCITVAGNSTFIMKYSNVPYFLHIKDSDIANTMREIFNFLWDSSIS